MQTRRQLFRQTFVALAATGSTPAHRVGIFVEDTLLSQESARGFAMLNTRTRFIVLPGAGERAIQAAPDLLQRARQGAWIIWEPALHGLPLAQLARMQSALQTTFGIRIGPPFRPGLYVEYLWPKPALTRSFLEAIPVDCAPHEIIARHGAIPIAMRRRIGRGGIVFLGSMLGPNLYAEEPESHAITKALLSSSLAML